jgi:hypothetical protein
MMDYMIPGFSEQRVQGVLRELRFGARLSWDEFAQHVTQAGFQVSTAAVRGYEEGRTKKVPLAYVEAVCRAFRASPMSFFGADLASMHLTEGSANEQLRGGRTRSLDSQSQSPIPQGVVHDPESLRRRFLSAISEYSDLEIERMCGLNHETVRQYRGGQWPSRGPNSSTAGKLARFLALHEQRRTAAATEEGHLPALIEGLIAFSEEWENDQEFRERYPKQGWISITDDAIQKLRELDLVQYDDEIAWLAYKRAVGYQFESADKVGIGDLGLTIDPFVARVTPRES